MLHLRKIARFSFGHVVKVAYIALFCKHMVLPLRGKRKILKKEKKIQMARNEF